MKKTCKYCDREFKNQHGLSIHFFYCIAKQFEQMKKQIVTMDEYHRLKENPGFLPVFRYGRWQKFVMFLEVGLIGDIRYILLQ